MLRSTRAEQNLSSELGGRPSLSCPFSCPVVGRLGCLDLLFYRGDCFLRYSPPWPAESLTRCHEVDILLATRMVRTCKHPFQTNRKDDSYLGPRADHSNLQIPASRELPFCGDVPRKSPEEKRSDGLVGNCSGDVRNDEDVVAPCEIFLRHSHSCQVGVLQA